MQEEEAAEEEALPRARKPAGDNKDKKVELGSSAPPPMPTTPLLTLLVGVVPALERERERERERQ